MENLLLLVHRIPYPPNKGDKIRSYHLLRHLVQQYKVYLGCFIDDLDDWQHVDTVKKWCAETYFAKLNPRTAKLRSIAALLSERPLSLDYYQHSALQAWVDHQIQDHNIRHIVIFSSAMGQFVEHQHQAKRVIDFVDVDSDKWLQYAAQKRWPLNWLYLREGRTLLNYEKRLAANYDAALFVSEAEANLFRRLAPESTNRIGYYNNGVDSDYFSPLGNYQNPYPSDISAIVFVGAMDYWPNIDAVCWFAEKIFPLIQQRYPDVCFYIVGTRPTEQVKELSNIAGIRVTGAVPDVRPYLAYAAIAVAPLRIARGIQNKVLEAMSMAKTIIVSPQALEGINATPGKELFLADNAEDFARLAIERIAQNNDDICSAARNKIVHGYNWDANLSQVNALLANT
jgi:sugar transferase (PEP-CTERM/EpsH1 system associated)